MLALTHLQLCSHVYFFLACILFSPTYFQKRSENFMLTSMPCGTSHNHPTNSQAPGRPVCSVVKCRNPHAEMWLARGVIEAIKYQECYSCRNCPAKEIEELKTFRKQVHAIMNDTDIFLFVKKKITGKILIYFLFLLKT